MLLLSAHANEPVLAPATCSRAEEEARALPEPAVAFHGGTRSMSNAAMDASCWIDEIDAARMEKAGAMFWIDIRSAEKAKASALHGALQIPAHELASKDFLREERVVLVGGAFDENEAMQACRSLRLAGFSSVHALAGGARAWAQAGRSISGSSLGPLDEMTPEEFIAGGMKGHWALVTVGLGDDETKLLPLEITKSFSMGEVMAGKGKYWLESMLAKHGRGKKSLNDGRSKRFLIVTRNAEMIDVLRREFIRNEVDVIFVKGGLTSYREYVSQWSGVLAYSNRGVVKPCGIN
ncbi:rhodanese-like domain-containing protein [Xylophilus sp. GW821-FHT01B05]